MTALPALRSTIGGRVLTRPVNWNKIDDPFDKDVWDMLIAQFWVPERIPVSQDLPSWSRLTPAERLTTMRVFTGLTMLDTVQSMVGAISMIPDAVTPHEAEVLTYIAAQESIHAKSYSYIFQTLANSDEIEEAFRWSEENDQLQAKAAIILGYYEGDDPYKRKVASVLLESFLFYSGFYLPFWFSSRARLTNTADVIRLIVRDESVHGAAMGYWLQRSLRDETPEKQDEIREFAYELLMELYDNEIRYTRDLYDELGRTEDVVRFLHYNANKALQNMGYDPLFPTEVTNVDPAVMASLDLGSETHDFFSGAGSSYEIAKHEELSDDEWSFGDDD